MRYVVAIVLKWKEILHSHKRQKISNSYEPRTTQEPPLAYCDIEMLRPLLIEDDCKQRKYYGAMFYM